MLRLSAGRRVLLADKLSDLANLAAGSTVLGQFLTDRPFSWLLALCGFAVWSVLITAALRIAKEGSR